MNKTILALDLGTTMGWSLSSDGYITSGTSNFKAGRFEGGGMRFLRFNSWLEEISKQLIDVVYFEEVRRHIGVDAAHVYGGFLSQLTAFCEKNSIPYQGVPVGTIKKFITGKGNASKQEVIEAIRNKGHLPKDDNEADSLALLYYAREQL